MQNTYNILEERFGIKAVEKGKGCRKYLRQIAKIGRIYAFAQRYCRDVRITDYFRMLATAPPPKDSHLLHELMRLHDYLFYTGGQRKAFAMPSKKAPWLASIGIQKDTHPTEEFILQCFYKKQCGAPD